MPAVARTELRLVRPKLLVCNGKILASELAPKVVATMHPSSLLRQPDEESRKREYKLFVADSSAALKAATDK